MVQDKCRGCKFNTGETCSVVPGDILPPTCPSLFAKFEALATSRARRINEEIHSCSMCPYSEMSMAEYWCRKAEKVIHYVRDGELKEIGIHRDCPLELA